MPQIHSFYTKLNTPNALSFCFNDLFKWSDHELEVKHDYIQWFFPLISRSRCCVNAPILTVEEIIVFSRTRKIQKLQRKALKRMLEFYGIKYPIFHTKKLFDKHTLPFWIDINGDVNHNYLRISRILASLNIFGNRKQAVKLYNYLSKQNMKYLFLHGKYMFPESTINHWRSAMGTTSENEIFHFELRRDLDAIADEFYQIEDKNES